MIYLRSFGIPKDSWTDEYFKRSGWAEEDLPDVYELEGQTYGVLSDVSGHGISAGMLAAFVKAGFDKQEPNLATALKKLNGKFAELERLNRIREEEALKAL